MIQLPFPSTIEAQPCNVTFLTRNTVVRKIQKKDGQTGSCAWTRQCLDKGGGGTVPLSPNDHPRTAHWSSCIVGVTKETPFFSQPMLA